MVEIREATPDDVDAIYGLIKELAVYEKAGNEVAISAEQLKMDGFGENPLFFAFVATIKTKVVGMALGYIRYSTWKGKCLFLEDIVVNQQHRRKGIGKKLFEALLKKAQKENFNLMSWQVLEWNAPAIAFYKKYPTEFDKEWINCKLNKEQIKLINESL
ncbi:MAG: GNAT family N-acetyltransferase [Vicingaceae bacterium]